MSEAEDRKEFEREMKRKQDIGTQKLDRREGGERCDGDTRL